MFKLWKRICAYLIDILIITILTQCLSSTTILNPNLNNYQKYRKEYTKQYTEYANFITKLDKYYQDKKLEVKEYQTLNEKYKTYQKDLDKYYKDNKLTKKNYNLLIKQATKTYQQKSNKIYYLIEKNSISEIIIYIILTLLYFIGFNYITAGQTLGKKIMKLKIESIDNSKKNVPISSYIIRTMMLYQTLYYIVRLIGILFLNQTNYLEVTSTFYNIQNLLDLLIISLILIREDKRGLHDILAKTKVISIKETI